MHQEIQIEYSKQKSIILSKFELLLCVYIVVSHVYM